MASGFFFGGMAQGISDAASSISTDMKLQSLLQLQLARDAQNQKHSDYLKLRSDLIDHMGQTVTALKNAHPDWTDLQVSSNPAVVGLKNTLAGFDKNLRLPDTADSVIAGLVAGPSQIQTEAALARAKEGPLAAEEKRARIDYLRSGIPGGAYPLHPMDPNDPNYDPKLDPHNAQYDPNDPRLIYAAPGTRGDASTVGGRPATFNQRFAQSAPASTTDVGADVGEQAGEDYLKKSVDPADADFVKSVANYDTDPNTASGRVPRGQLKSRREAVIEQAMAYARAKGETYNPRAFKVVQDFLGSGKHGDLVRSLNVVTDHMQTIKSLGEALHNGDNQTINALFQRWATEFGKPAPTNMTLGLKLVGTELVKAMGVAGAGSKEDRQELQNTINTSSSNSQIIGAIDRVAGPLLSGQLNGLRNQYVSGGGPRERFDKALFPATKKYLDSERGEKKPAGTGEWSVERID